MPTLVGQTVHPAHLTAGRTPVELPPALGAHLVCQTVPPVHLVKLLLVFMPTIIKKNMKSTFHLGVFDEKELVVVCEDPATNTNCLAKPKHSDM